MILQTERLILRELTMDDLSDLYEILSDAETMKHYPRPKTLEESKMWIQKNIDRYENDGFGLWAIELKETNRFIGECGITMQNIDGERLPEIGYHINKKFTKKGYATEAAKACRNYGFDQLNFNEMYSYMKYTNLSSSRVAEKNGMSFIKEYPDDINEFVKVFRITKDEYKLL